MKRFTALLLSLALILSLAACSSSKGSSSGRSSKSRNRSTTVLSSADPKDVLKEIYNWLVGDIWNDGFCDMSHYYYDGKSSTGQTMDPEFTIQQLEKAMEKKEDYDQQMASLPDDYADIKEIWVKLSEQVDILYEEIEQQGTSRDGDGLDTGLYHQYFDAFADAYFDLDE